MEEDHGRRCLHLLVSSRCFVDVDPCHTHVAPIFLLKLLVNDTKMMVWPTKILNVI